MSDIINPSGKIAFMFPAKFNLEGARSPVLNFSVRDNDTIAMSVGISFLELNAGSPYFVNLKLYDPTGEEVTISSTMGAVPGEYIDPIKRSSFLTASYYFEPSLNGSYRFTCELLDVIRDSKPVDTMSLWFNVFGVGDSSAS